MIKAYATVLGVETPEEQQKALLQLPKMIKESDEATKIQAKSEQEVADILKLRVNYQTELNTALQKSVDIIRTDGGLFRLPTPRREGVAPDEGTLAAMKTQADLLSLTNRAFDLLIEKKSSTKEFSDIITKLYAAHEAFATGEAKRGWLEAWTTPEIAPALETIIDKLEKTAEAQERIKESAEAAELGEPARAQLDAINNLNQLYNDAATSIKEVNTETGPNAAAAAMQGAAGNQAATQQILADVQKQIEALKARNALMAAGAKGAEGKALGGIIYRQMGGYTPRGTDTIPAMLSPGEFVINADSTRKFFSQLVAINSGKQPVYRERGGVVTNVGDVNIIVQESSTPKQTARETMTLMQRELRRHSSRSL